MTPPVLVIAGTSSNVGKTTVTCSLMAAFSACGLTVQPFKVGPDFLDGKHHEAACGIVDNDSSIETKGCSVNLDGWLMGGKSQVLESFHHHSRGADLCIVEGVMGLFDGKDGDSEQGSTAQIAKWLQAPVILVVDASCMARSTAAQVLGYKEFDPELRLAGVVVNKVNGGKHKEWIQQALMNDDRLVDVGTKDPILFVGAMPQDKTVAIPERHLGLSLPHEQDDDCFVRLAQMARENLDLDGLLQLAQSATPPSTPTTNDARASQETTCRIGIARDEAFHFYYLDNFKLLQECGAKLVYFSLIHDKHLPNDIDAIYIGGGYPELFANELQENASMRLDVESFALAGGVIYAECGGLMYLSTALWIMDKETGERQRFEMCNVLPDVVVTMTPHMKMGYADICFQHNPIFAQGSCCRGQKFHFSEVAEAPVSLSRPYLVTLQQPDAVSEEDGYCVRNVVASYFHLHWASEPALAQGFVSSAIQNSPIRKNGAFAVSFVSAATEIAFALGAEDKLVGVTSVCDYPAHARAFPRRVLCQSPFDATNMTSEEVAAAMEEYKTRTNDGPPGHWIIDKVGLKRASPRVAFVQETCEICDASKSDVLAALDECSLLDTCKTVQVSPTTLDGMLQSIMDVGNALGVGERSLELCNKLRRRLEVVEQKLAQHETRKRPRVLSLEGLAPLCVGGGWLPDVKMAAGCEDALGDEGGAPSRILQWSDVLAADPDVLIISPCSASPSRTMNELHLLNSPEFWKLQCVQQGNVYVIDHGKFSCPGPRLVDAIEMLATLLCYASPPENFNVDKAWNDEVFKYECSVGKIHHCTTELSTRFRPCFSQAGDSSEASIEVSDLPTDKSTFEHPRRIKVTPCSIPNDHLPCDRSAHNMVALEDCSVLLFGGDSDSMNGQLSDVWKLCTPAKGWNSDLDLFDDETSPRLGFSPVWERLQCSTVADENVPTLRSNGAAVVCGHYLLVFGGWDQYGQCLDNCELLHLETLCWTHCSTRGVERPTARGNPTLVYSAKRNEALLFGGWNKIERLDELWILDMETWEWKQQKPASDVDVWPLGRTDHSSVLWIDDKGNESMIVFGGSVQGQGSCSELWSYSLDMMKWKVNASCCTPPSPRTSHCAAIVGQGDSCKMVVVGGTEIGSGSGALPSDAWVLSLQSMQWQRLSWTGNCVERCRHGMTVVSLDKIVLWGGYNGESVVQDESFVWLGSLENEMGQPSTLTKPAEETLAERKRLQERWDAEVPIRESDLPSDMFEKAKKSPLPGALFKAMHRFAVSKNRDTYIDPSTGYSVFTQTYLKRRACCGNGCRHCPYGHVNVIPKQAEDAGDNCESDEDIDW